MSSYVMSMKEILSKKRKLEDYEMVALTEKCNAILQKKLPPKLKDPEIEIGRSLPYYHVLTNGRHSVKHPSNIIEDVLVKVDKFNFTTDFIILDKEEDEIF
ncbi:uncharacterized protein LOC133796260 [Humulus lupulus]|uniref:uncharacterized protein LOC133796260 n=1 Tax=Humulus lupulus TaxID=3486 RepID=UPI002B4164C6|nr:uncharacterized protein LOC133796260 [Humulus lupulus]